MSGTIVVNGMVWGKKEPLVSPIAYDQFVNTLLKAFTKDKKLFRRTAKAVAKGTAIRGFFEFRSPDLNDPLETKWALLMPDKSAKNKAIEKALKPLVDHRQGQIIYGPESHDQSSLEDWIFKEYNQKLDNERPYYILMVGGPDSLPFRFQYTLDVHAAVGRIHFDRLEDYEAYAKKVVDFETRNDHSVEKRSVFFAPEMTGDMATYLSRHRMTDPLVESVKAKGIPVSYLAAEKATLANLISNLRCDAGSHAPALVYTAGHGLGVPGENEDDQQKIQGALCCQDYNGRTGFFSADIVPAEPFLHGSIMFAFACYGAGTPRESDFFHWVKDPNLLGCRPNTDFVAALPKRLLAHPQGPLAFVGHIDPAWVHCFADPNCIGSNEAWSSRLGPFQVAVDCVLDGATIGYATSRFNQVYSLLSVKLADMEDDFRRDAARGKNLQWTEDMVEVWITRNDTQNFIILGDPAVKAKMP